MASTFVRIRNRFRNTYRALRSVKPTADKLIVTHGSEAIQQASMNAALAIKERRIVDWIYWKCVAAELDEREIDKK